MKKIFKQLKKREWLMIAASVLFIVAQVFCDLRMPDYMSEITILVQTEGSVMGDILLAGGKMLLCALGSLASAVIVGYFAAQVAASFSKRLRGLVFDKTMDFSMEEINNFSTSSLITRSTNDIRQLQIFIALGLQMLIKAPIMAVWAVTKIAGKSWQWSIATGAAVLFLIGIISIIMIFVIPKTKTIQKQTDDLNRVTRENLTGLRVVRAYNAEEYQEAKFEETNEKLTNTNLFNNRLTSLISPSMSLVLSGLSLAIYWIGAYMINTAGMMDKLPIFSDMVVFTSYAMQVVSAFIMLTMIFIMYPRASVSAGRVNEVLDTETRIVDGKLKASAATQMGTVEFKNVSFKYPDAADYVIRDISFTADKGETVAFIGSTGSGKSTLLNLVPRFYDATEGEVLVDGINVRDYELEELNKKLGYVSQKAVLFSGSVRSNIDYGDSGKGQMSDSQVRRAVSIAQGAGFVENLQGGYDGRVAQGGTNLSGGQKQRLSIARAVAREPEIMLFDDSFSALDYKTDRVLRTELKEQTEGVTNLIVAQRIGTIIDADKIIVLDEGEMVGMGTHTELLETCETYREIAHSQLSEEELAVG